MSTPDDPLSLHVAGATVRHRGPFSGLVVPPPGPPPSQEFVDRWVAPFYLNLPGPEFDAEFDRVSADIDAPLVETLLREFNWRHRIVGGYFAAIRNIVEAEDLIGTLLLRSDLCYAGQGYCLALARCGNASALRYLTTYLDYYLDRPDLWYDQGDAMGAVAYLDRVHGRNDLARFLPRWHRFVADKPNWKIGPQIEYFSGWMDRVHALARRGG